MSSVGKHGALTTHLWDSAACSSIKEQACADRSRDRADFGAYLIMSDERIAVKKKQAQHELEVMSL